ncbi:family 20 glycosylhydrolase [Pseudoalteromonas sp. OOF1S-7]|uniref:family 20 glycosylhydrolase n=1 Tax=Pseudoalteromonas sp. OOF1S-7 TaxID=2917757 RepID=UPI001EF6093F|nr:family 20 glycosylhydrolase [Pseudoalteromonas sp. OOF1S-7]MCG7537259.1 carbohydate-binding domain-containing protein [Pseudoalteromonas sp. OOF1S-7]
MKKFVCLFMALLGAQSVHALTQGELNEVADNLEIRYHLIDAVPKLCPAPATQCYLSELRLRSPVHYRGTDWAIYFSQLMPIYQVESEQFRIEHLNGDLHRLTPTAQFNGFSADDEFIIRFYTKNSQITRSEFMPNYILADQAQRLLPRVIASTRPVRDEQTQLELQPYLAPFESYHQLRVSSEDQTPWMSAAYLAQHQSEPEFTYAPEGVIPTPREFKVVSQGRINLEKGVRFELTGIDLAELEMAGKRLAQLGVQQTQKGLPVSVTVDPSLAIAAQGYQFNSSTNRIAIQASDAAGAFYGVQTLAGLMDLKTRSIPSVAIADAPRYAFRGLHIDSARNFRSKQFILDTIAQMGAYKLNKLHLHLADDEGWRLAIAGLPELTKVGGLRCLELSETRCLLPQLGAGTGSGAPRNGHYSQQDYSEILRYAKAHHIEVIPSLDMPGHSRAAIIAMEARYRALMAKGKEAAANEYRLVEEADKTRYSSIQHYHDNTLNVCLPATYRFVGKVLNELQRMHERAGVPLKTYHIGADETAGAWLDSPACQALNKKQTITSMNGYFIEQVAAMVAEKGITVAGWSDGLSDVDPQKMPKQVQTNVWSTLSEQGHRVAHQQANQGWEVVLSLPDVTYFDFPYQSHPQERGNHWASRALDTRKVFEFMPDNLPVHAEFWRDVLHHNYSADDKDSGLKPGVGYTGMQGHLWSEMIRDDVQAEYMLYPRLLALAERAWHKPGWAVPYQAGRIYNDKSGYFSAQSQQLREQDWQRFVALLGYRELPKLTRQGRFFRIPTVAASRREDDTLKLFSEIPGFELEAHINGRWVSYHPKLDFDSVDAVRAVLPDNARAGRALPIPAPVE